MVSEVTILICPSESSSRSSWKFIFRASSISSSVSIWPYSVPSSSIPEFSLAICKYGISSVIRLILTIVSETVDCSVALIICCIPFTISCCRFTVLNLPVFTSTGGIITSSLAFSPPRPISMELICKNPSFSWRNLRYFSSCCLLSGWYSILSSNALSTYGPSPNHKISSSQASTHLSTFSALWYRYASS